MSALKERAVCASRLLAGRGFAWTGLGLGSTLLRSVAENLLAVVLILFLFSFGLVDGSRMPHWLPAPWVQLGSQTVLAILVAVGLSCEGCSSRWHRSRSMHDWVSRLPGGLDYLISENEDGLSSGQGQRLALARGFLRRPALLILDEASANPDVDAEAELAEVLRSLTARCTTIIVSHKPGILVGAERVFRLQEPLHA